MNIILLEKDYHKYGAIYCMQKYKLYKGKFYNLLRKNNIKYRKRIFMKDSCCKKCNEPARANKLCLYHYNKEYRKQNKNILKEKNKIYRVNNIDRINKVGREYYAKNKDRIRKKNRIKKQIRYKKDVRYKLMVVMRARIGMALKLNVKHGKSLKLLGCTISELKKYIESQFQLGMTWENHSFRGWHIDHIIPISSFDLTKEEEQKKCFHYTNLQPLWATDNLRKNNKILVEV